MKKSDEIKKGLEICLAFPTPRDGCNRCPYIKERRPMGICRTSLKNDALALIQQIEADNAEKDKRIADLEKELAAVKRERDAAVSVLESIATGRESKCDHCMHRLEGCRSICWGTRWQWRGVCPDTEVQDGNQADNA